MHGEADLVNAYLIATPTETANSPPPPMNAENLTPPWALRRRDGR